MRRARDFLVLEFQVRAEDFLKGGFFGTAVVGVVMSVAVLQELLLRFRKGSHAIYKTEYHVVWTPRYRRKIFIPGVRQYAQKLLKNLDGLDPNIEVLKVNIPLDHVHLKLDL